ncbi:MAG: N-acetylglucosamine/diacetylchitobiose ABC transporter substrate-binding protein [Propionibacteriaceae bacterium]
MSEELRDLLPGVSRRTVIRSAAVGAALIGTGALSACATGGGGGGEETEGPDAGGTEDKTDDNPFGVDKAKPLEIVIFDGGYGDKYGAAHAKLYNDWAGGEVAEMTSTVKIATTLQPRFSGGNPPEVIDNSGDDSMPTATLVAQKQLADLQPLLDAPSIDDPSKTIGDILLPGTVETGSYNGTMHELGYVFSMWGIWYSSTLFEDKGWEMGKTWDEFVDLSDKIKSDGSMAPFIHTGVHANYMGNILTTQAAKLAGNEVMLNIDNLATDAWTNDAMVKVAEQWEKYGKDGYILSSAEGLDHTTSQTQWLLGKAAMIPCGSWLENEMAGKGPDDFEMVVAPVPSTSAEDAMPYETIWGGSGEPFIIGEKSKNKAGGYEYMRIMLSQEATSAFADLTGNLAAVQGAGDNLKDPSSALQSVADASAAAGDNIVQTRFEVWYAPLKDALKDNVRNLLAGKASADQFCSAMQEASDQVAADDKIEKYERS